MVKLDGKIASSIFFVLSGDEFQQIQIRTHSIIQSKPVKSTLFKENPVNAHSAVD
jgi:hypothetical protein